MQSAGGDGNRQRETRVILVDDDIIFARSLLRRLQRAGINAHHADGRDSALLLFVAHEPDGVIMDIGLGAVSGVDVAAELLALRPALRLVFVTGDLDETRLARAAKLGAVFPKTVEVEGLLRALGMV